MHLCWGSPPKLAKLCKTVLSSDVVVVRWGALDASLSYSHPASTPENRKEPKGMLRMRKLYKMPKCFNPKSSEAVGTVMEM